MLNAAFRKKFSRMYPGESEDFQPSEPRFATNNYNSGNINEKRSLIRTNISDDDVLDAQANIARSGSHLSYGQRGNCRKFIRRNASGHSGLPRTDLNGPRRYQRNRRAYQRADSEDDEESDDNGNHRVPGLSKPKYGPRDLEVWSKRPKGDTNEKEARMSSASLRQDSGLRDWLAWRCYVNQNLAYTILTTSQQVGVRTLNVTPDFSQKTVSLILDEYADREQKPPTSLHENDYLMFGLPRAKVKPDLDNDAIFTSEKKLLQNKPSAPNLESFVLQKMIAQKAKAAQSKCLPSLRFRRKIKKPKREAVSEPEYLPSRYERLGLIHKNAERKALSDDGRGRMYSGDYPYSPWGQVVRSRDKMALPPESSFLAQVRSKSRSSYWSTSSTSLSVGSSSDAETDSDASYSSASSIFVAKTNKKNKKRPYSPRRK